MTESEIIKRVSEILKKQSNFEQLVRELQDDFYREVLNNFPFIAYSEKNLSTFFLQFQNNYHIKVLLNLADDMQFIIDNNLAYFSQVMEGESIEIQAKRISKQLQKSFGFDENGNINTEGYLQDIAKDTSLKRTFRAGLIKFGFRDKLTSAQSKELELFIKGDKDKLGMWESFYSKPDGTGSSVFDVYQKADRLAQNLFSQELQLNCAIYTGGLIDTSRQFCTERNGKIFLRSEIQSWENLRFAGKSTPYDPFIDCGGIRCRHHLGFIGNATAMRLDKTIKVTKDNIPYRV